LLKDTAPAWFESRERPRRAGRSEAGRPRRAEPPAPAVIDDESVLGKTLGSREAARLRGRFNDLLQRISRRARTPEDRARLTERLSRLNPDDWADEAAVRAGAASVEQEWDAIAGELPQRRRGRRGGRMRAGDSRQATEREAPDAFGEDLPGASDGTEPEAASASGIISGEGDPDEPVLEQVEAGLMGQDDGVSGAGDLGGLGPDADAVDGADRPDFPGRDRDHLD
jgi:hypothetical protein